MLRDKRRWRTLGLMDWVGRHEPMLLVALALIGGGLWGFIKLVNEIAEQETHAFDEAILLAMRSATDRSDPVGPQWMEELGRDFTALGGMGVLTFLTLAVAGFLLLQRQFRLTILVLIAVFGGYLMSTLLKQGFDRPRPNLVPHSVYVYTASFPSGHSMMSAVTYLTLGALLARSQIRWRMKAYFLLIALFLTVAVGVSRVYLGVHWPTDVVAGWTAGAVWALLCWLIARQLQRQGQIEKAGEEEQNYEQSDTR